MAAEAKWPQFPRLSLTSGRAVTREMAFPWQSVNSHTQRHK